MGADRVARSLGMAVLALLLYGGWAFLANRSHGAIAGLRAFSVQGALSFVSTLTITLLMEILFGWPSRPLTRFSLAFLGACAVMVTATIGAHWLAGTPELWATTAPVLAIGTGYCASYSLGLTHLKVPAT